MKQECKAHSYVQESSASGWLKTRCISCGFVYNECEHGANRLELKKRFLNPINCKELLTYECKDCWEIVTMTQNSHRINELMLVNLTTGRVMKRYELCSRCGWRTP